MAQWGFDESVPKVMAEKDASYRAMIEKARLLLAEGRTVVLDATFHKRYRREWAFALAREVGVGFRVISVSCSEEETKRRLDLRKGSDARDDVLKSMESWNVMRVQSDELCEQVNCFYYDSEKSTGDAAVNWILGRE